ncbi:MAG: FAD-dependent oxidoreductase [Verrucomicrobiales bacterium]
MNPSTALHLTLFAIFAIFCGQSHSQDIVVYGGTPGGIASALSAARMGREVVLVESHDHVGGMSTSGLGKSDIENRAMIGGIFQEFVAKILDHYVITYGPEHENVGLCRDGYYYEPSVAEAVFESMLAEESSLAVMKGWRLHDARVDGDRLVAIEILNRHDGSTRTLEAEVFIDATYEGDLYAAAGAEYRLGRESRDEFGEPHAGVVYFDYQEREFLPGTTGEGDDGLPAYTYRLCLTKDPANSRRLTEPPPGYDREDYLGYFDDLEAGRLAGPKVLKPGRGYYPEHFDTLVRALSVTDIPNGKTDVNINPRPLGFPFPEENRGYVEGDEATRERIRQRHRSLAVGLIWFLQNDPEVPQAHRVIANELHWPKDEFTDNDHFPWQLYVREGRRLVGEHTLTQHDITGKGEAPVHQPDSIAVGEFPIDSFPVRKRQPGDTVVLEGYLGMLEHITRPYEIPYRIMVPAKLDGLLAPVAASTTHVAFSSIRMEPTWMALGQAAGVAAHLAIEHGGVPRAVPVAPLQKTLAAQGQVLRHAATEAQPE